MYTFKCEDEGVYKEVNARSPKLAERAQDVHVFSLCLYRTKLNIFFNKKFYKFALDKFNSKLVLQMTKLNIKSFESNKKPICIFIESLDIGL